MTQTVLQDLFVYNPETGWFTNRYSRGRAKEGERAGSPSGHGYRKICVNYSKHYEHHLAWFYVYGEYPDEMDHINGIRDDNRITNLRVCTRTQNCFNKKPDRSGLTGAYLDKRVSQWYAKIQVGGQAKFLGNYDTPELAHKAYLAALRLYAGEFAYQST